MQRTRLLSSELAEHIGETVAVAGWVHRRRLLKSVAFLVLRDAAGFAQIVANPSELEKLSEESVVEITATVTANPVAPGGVELTSPLIRVLSEVSVPLPVELHRPALTATLPTQLDHAAL